MFKIVVEALSVFDETASEVYFIDIFRNESVGKHLYNKFVYDCNRDVLSLLSLLDFENKRLLSAYFDELIADKVKHNLLKESAVRAAYEHDEKERLRTMEALEHEAKRALEIEKEFDALPEKVRKAIKL